MFSASRALTRYTRPVLSLARCTPPLSRSYIVGFPRGPTLAPLDPVYYPEYDDTTDPGLNGGYVNPPAEKRQFRDPYADWWDVQGRKNFGEPVHEDDDILGRMSPEEYTWISPGLGAFQWCWFLAALGGLMGGVYAYYPDKPSYPRTFPDGGLERALGGRGALPAASD